MSEGRLSRCESKHARNTGVKVHVHPPLHQNITRANEFIDGLVGGEGATELLTKGTIHTGRLAHPRGSPQRSASRDRQQEDGKERGTGIEETPLSRTLLECRVRINSCLWRSRCQPTIR